MDVTSTYKVKILQYNHIFDETVRVYRKAVAFFLNVCRAEWGILEPMVLKKRNNHLEQLTHRTAQNPEPKYDFDSAFYKMPAYLRRAAAQEAIGAYSSYESNHENWIKTGRNGKEPRLTFNRSTMPVLYKGNMFKWTDRCTAKVKIYHRNDWVWLEVSLREQDIRYIEMHCDQDKIQSPKLKKQGKRWYLSFPFERTVAFEDVPVGERTICAVDLGLNQNAVCSIVRSNGTVVARKFINFPTEKDHLYKALGRQKKAQQHGNRKTPVLWKHVNDINTEISRKTAKAIMAFAVLHHVDVIVFEHLETGGKLRGSKKQRLALWRKKEIQRIVEHNAHKNSIRISRVCAWGTSKLAFDGSGCVTRGSCIQNGELKHNYSICVFPNGKTYHCDLNASYNIGARYFIRELLKSESVMTRLPARANDLRYGTGTTRTLSTLIRLYADLSASCA